MNDINALNSTFSTNDTDTSNSTTETTTKDEDSSKGTRSAYKPCNFGFLLLSNC